MKLVMVVSRTTEGRLRLAPLPADLVPDDPIAHGADLGIVRLRVAQDVLERTRLDALALLAGKLLHRAALLLGLDLRSALHDSPWYLSSSTTPRGAPPV